MADYIPPVGTLLQFGFFPVTTPIPVGNALQFAWNSSPISYLIPPPYSVDFALRKVRYMVPLYDEVDFEIKEYTQASSSIFSLFQDISVSFVFATPITASLTKVLASFSTQFSLTRLPAWSGNLYKGLDAVAFSINAQTPIAISASFSATLASVISSVTINFGSSLLTSTLLDVTSSFSGTVPIPIEGTFTNSGSDTTSSFIAKHYAGTFISSLTDVTTAFVGKIPIPITCTFAGTLSSVITSVRALHYAGTVYRVFANTTFSITGEVPLVITCSVSFTLGDFSLSFQTLFRGVSGTLAATFIKTALVMHGGSAIGATLNAVPGVATGNILLRTPLNLVGTFTVTLANLDRIFPAKFWPTGTWSRLLYDLTGTIYGTLPVFIRGPLFAYTYPLIPAIRIGAWPAGNLTRLLDKTTGQFLLKTPIPISVIWESTLEAINSSVSLKVLIGGYVRSVTQTFDLSWYLQFTKPRLITLSAVLSVTGSWYAKTITYGTVTANFADTTVSIRGVVPIAIMASMLVTTAPLSNVYFRARSELGGPLTSVFYQTTFAGYGWCLLGVNLSTTLDESVGVFSGKTPVAVAAVLHLTFEKLSANFYGIGHHRFNFINKLQSATTNILGRVSTVGWIDIKSITTFTWKVNPFFIGYLGERWPIHSGKIWKLRIFANNGYATTTEIKKIRLFVKDEQGELVDALVDAGDSHGIILENVDFNSEEGMVWEHEFDSPIIVYSYEIETY